jgi:hypothetical protein
LELVAEKTNSEEIRDQIEVKQMEIDSYVEQQQDKFEDLSLSQQEVLIKETTKVIALKAVDAVTIKENVVEDLMQQVQIDNPTEMQQAKEALLESVSDGDTKTLLISTNKTLDEVSNLLRKFDSSVLVTALYEDHTEIVYEVVVR